MISGQGRPLTQEDCEEGKFAPLMLFDCRGYEPVGFVFGSGWKVESVSLCSSSSTLDILDIAYCSKGFWM